MKTLKKILAVAVFCLFPALTAVGCGVFQPEQDPEPSITYTFAEVNYHYQYDVAIEEYWQEKYTIVKGETYYIDEFYTPPEKAGYTFLGYTREQGGAGELVELPFGITGEGGSGKIYNLYAKYEPIAYNVVYHLNGGVNSPDNPQSATGKVVLKDPVKDGCVFWGWFEDEDFKKPIKTLSLRLDEEDTTIHCYAKWGRVSTISYSVNVTNTTASHIKIHEDNTKTSYTSNGPTDTRFNLDHHTYAGYLFLGWTYEGQTEPMRGIDLTTITIPKEQEGDLHFVANYAYATPLQNNPDLTTETVGATCTITVTSNVREIIIADNPDYSIIKANIVIRYRGDEQPKLLYSGTFNITFEKISDET